MKARDETMKEVGIILLPFLMIKFRFLSGVNNSCHFPYQTHAGMHIPANLGQGTGPLWGAGQSPA